jgi:hypothetical protein
MNHVSLYGCLLSLVAATTSYGVSTTPAHAPASLSVDQIVERNVAANEPTDDALFQKPQLAALVAPGPKHP